MITLEGGNGIAVAHIGVDEMAQAGLGRIVETEAVADGALCIAGFQNAHLIGEVTVFKSQQAADSGVKGRVKLYGLERY